MDNALARQFRTASLLRFALPNIIMMVFLFFYTIVDGMFISRFVGTLALSAINMSYPLNCLEMAVVSYKYGAQDTDQLKRIFRSCLGFITACSAGMYVLARLVIGRCLTLFTDADSAVYAITMEDFPLYAVSFLFMGIGIFASSLFTAFSNGTVSAAISFARTFVFLVGMLLILPELWGETGIWLAVPAAELLGLAVSAGFLIWGRERYQY